MKPNWKLTIGSLSAILAAWSLQIDPCRAAGTKAGEASPATTPSPSRLALDNYAPKIQAALGIKNTSVNILPLIAEAIKEAKGGEPKARAEALNKLVDALLQGPDPAALLNESVPLLEISDDASPSPKYGTSLQLESLVQSIWTLGAAAQKTDPKRASEIARAATMLSAMQDFKDHWLNCATDIHTSPDDAKKLLNLTDGQFQQLSDVIDARVKLTVVIRRNEEAAGRLIDAMAAQKGTPNMEDVKKILLDYDQAFREGAPQLGYRYDEIWKCWTFLNLMKIRSSQDGEDATKKTLLAWKKDFPEPDVVRWVDQALTRTGSPPGRQVADYQVGPDGKIHPYVPASEPAKK